MDHDRILAQTPTLFLQLDLTPQTPPLGGWPTPWPTFVVELCFVIGEDERRSRYTTDTLPDICAIAECLAFLSHWRLVNTSQKHCLTLDLDPDVLTAVPPATFLGWQHFPGQPSLALWQLTADIPGHPQSSTVTSTTLRDAGYIVEEPPQ